MRVQRYSEDRLLAMPGVAAVGIGRTERSGETVLRILLEDPASPDDLTIPESLDGVPVEVSVSGKFRALGCPGEAILRPAAGGLETAEAP